MSNDQLALITLLSLGLLLGSGLWIAIAGGMLVYAVYTFLIAWPKDEPRDDASPGA